MAFHLPSPSGASRLKRQLISVFVALCAVMAFSASVLPARAEQVEQQQRYAQDELLNAGHTFFGTASAGLASVLERTVQQYGLPNGYVLGEEASGALFGGLRYGEGMLHTRNAGDHKVFWQGPSLGWDIGGDGNRTMMLVYNLNSTQDIFHRFVGLSGQAYLVGGLGITALKHRDTILVPVRTGVGARLGVNVGYLKMRPYATWNPF